MIKKLITLFKLGRKVAKSDMLKITSRFKEPPLAVKILFKILSLSFSEKKENNSLILNIENSFEPTNSFAKKRLKSGIGNSNTKRRLDLIYKDQYSLKIMETKKVFTINLQIPLT